MSSDKKELGKEYNPTLTDVNRARERQTVIDPNKGPNTPKSPKRD